MEEADDNLGGSCSFLPTLDDDDGNDDNNGDNGDEADSDDDEVEVVPSC